MPTAPGTPSQTSGPYSGLGLPFPGGGDLVPAGHPGAVALHGLVLDGEGAPVPGALLEFWQPGPDGSRAGAPGSLRRDGLTFTGFARVATRGDGHYVLRTLLPGGVPYVSVCLHVRGLQRHLFTRAYFSEPSDDPLLAAVPEERRGTLLAVPEKRGAGGCPVYRFDVRLRGEGETVFLTV
ncbi:protocatechuate 3,4-dioxygenase subunit alpha [Streptomyces sp. I05A-00742]|uniref:protocatechuate 3,4-dioxygenase subunit alpha n=1 Tax=Streptomyces sp. I05A-00742 TaxID=2732853 RepID=UPI00148868FB|nr:protocatechuate 3,4-dioxygenase subunit alpha [Streptomyces sp. I05A-00742]